MPTTNWRSKYRTLLREVERLRREIDVLRGVVREYASEKVDWCTHCDMVVACRPTCVQCGTRMLGICSDCATESSVHDLDECEEVMCRSCRQETLVQIYGNLNFD